jgi:hypothetical protein
MKTRSNLSQNENCCQSPELIALFKLGFGRENLVFSNFEEILPLALEKDRKTIMFLRQHK